jgi:hypothetical protein
LASNLARLSLGHSIAIITPSRNGRVKKEPTPLPKEPSVRADHTNLVIDRNNSVKLRTHLFGFDAKMIGNTAISL